MAPRAQGSSHLLSGLAKCGKCGMNLRTHLTKGKTAVHVSYQHRTPYTGEKCLTIHKSGSRMEALVLEQVAMMAQLRDSAMAVARTELASGRKPTTSTRDDLVRQLAEGSTNFDKWVDRLERGLIDEEQFAQLNAAHLAQRRQLREHLEKVEVEAERQVDAELVIAEVESILADFDSAWEAMTVDERRETLRSLVEYLKVYDGYMDLKLLFRPEVRLSLDFGRSGRPRTTASSKEADQ